MRELIAIGDLHLTDSTGKGGLASYIDDHDAHVAALVGKALKWAAKRSIKNVVLLGDLCQSPRMSYNAQLALLSIFRQPFEFHVILGNHDMMAEDPLAGHSLQLMQEFGFPNVHIYEEPTKVGKVNFLPWPHKRFAKDCLNCAHIDVQGSVSDSGRAMNGDNLNCSSADALIGHIHTSQKVRNSVYPGTLYQTNFGERAEKFFAHSVYDDGWETTLVPVQPKYVLHTVEVKTKRDLKSVPASSTDLVKLILLDQARVTAADYQHLNVVKVQTVNSAAELALAQVEDLREGSSVEISTTEFVTSWINHQQVDPTIAQRALTLRAKILNGAAK